MREKKLQKKKKEDEEKKTFWLFSFAALYFLEFSETSTRLTDNRGDSGPLYSPLSFPFSTKSSGKLIKLGLPINFVTGCDVVLLSYILLDRMAILSTLPPLFFNFKVNFFLLLLSVLKLYTSFFFHDLIILKFFRNTNYRDLNDFILALMLIGYIINEVVVVQ